MVADSCSQSAKTVYAAVYKHNKPESVQEVKAKNGASQTVMMQRYVIQLF